jgi:CheY-like chemotaxis protein
VTRPAALTPFEQRGPRVGLLLADEDSGARSLIASQARETIEDLDVLEAEDGAEAMQIGLQLRPQLALLDVNLPLLSGIDVAVSLRALHPEMRLALQGADAATHRERAGEQCLPLFDKLDMRRTLGWLHVEAAECARSLRVLRTLSQACSGCGYGIAQAIPPERCPMCQRESPWIHTPWRPFSGIA